MFIGLRPQSQKTSLSAWHKFTSVSDQSFSLPNLVTKGSSFAGAWTSSGSAPSAGAVNVTITPTFVQATAKAEVSTKTIDRVTISAHGIFLYNDLPADFFHQYTTYTYGGPHITTPEDEGCLMIPFNLYPGTYQPSGHVNVSRAREFYIRYVSSVIGQIVDGTAIPGELNNTSSQQATAR
jgi:Large eukaryotic DNA virus major capsid protein